MAIDIDKIRRTHKDAAISRKIGNVIVETQAIASRKTNDLNWYEETDKYYLHYIPKTTGVLEFINELIDRTQGGSRLSWQKDLPGEASATLTLEDIERRLARLAQNVFIAEVKEILPAVKRINNSGEQVIFEDVARLEITSKQNELINGLSVYVYQHDFSSLQEIDFERSIGQVFPVSIQGTEFSIRERRINELSHKNENIRLATVNEDELIAIGKVSFAEEVLHRYIDNQLKIREQYRSEDEEPNDIIGDDVDVIIVKMTDKGAWAMTEQGERIFIQHKYLSYKYGSRTYNYLHRRNTEELKKFYYSVGDLLKVRLLNIFHSLPTDAQKARGINHGYYLITGTALPFEKDPLDVVRDMIKSGKNRVYVGQIVDYSPEKKVHLFEVEGAWKYPMALAHSPQIRQSDYIHGNKLSVRFLGGKIETIINEKGKTYEKVTGRLELNTKMAPKSVSRFF